jgi:hypothetical protein
MEVGSGVPVPVMPNADTRGNPGSHFFASPSSTRRRMASERVVSFLEAHLSTSSTVEGGIRDETIVPRPVAGRPRFFFWSTFIDFFMILGLHKMQAEGKHELPPRL